MSSSPVSTQNEIQERIQRGYLERLDKRIRKMRKLLTERDWHTLRVESIHLKNTAAGFGLPQLTQLAAGLEAAIPEKDISKATPLPNARQAAEALFTAIDQVLVNRTISF